MHHDGDEQDKSGEDAGRKQSTKHRTGNESDEKEDDVWEYACAHHLHVYLLALCVCVCVCVCV